MLRHQFLLNFVDLNVGNGWKTYKSKLLDHLLLLNRIVGAKITATVCCLFFRGKDKNTARDSIGRCDGYRRPINTRKVLDES